MPPKQNNKIHPVEKNNSTKKTINVTVTNDMMKDFNKEGIEQSEAVKVIKSVPSTKKKVISIPKDINRSTIREVGDPHITDQIARPLITATDLITPDEIRERMKDYEKVPYDQIPYLQPGCRLRYFEIIENQYKFRSGGTLIVNGYPDYLLVSSGRKNWSVQLNANILFKEIDFNEIRKEYARMLEKDSKTLNHLIHTLGNRNMRIKKLENALANKKR
jgi:hypothetical protein